ncbi:DUF1810 domain-containing protein [Roseomonas sp. CCTCC AB2023176]|uniref:DUF1810 domain-containing protein n=1 Tax=Roseomonas sp. CCTCC AB2023176 TaxID=3342640 RepID=UPI0035E072FD
MTAGPFDLDRFLRAQEPEMESVRRELEEGRKRTHWMWFVFPQIAGLGFSDAARRYAISGTDEARAYLAHPVLGPRLLDCTALVNAVRDRTAHDILGSPDDLKFRSCMTLFAAVAEDPGPFRAALDRYFDGEGDPATLSRLAAAAPRSN